MASKYIRLLQPTVLTANFIQPDSQVADLGGYRVLEAYIKILKAGPAGATIVLSHNASMDANNWKQISATSLAQNGTDLYVEVPGFMRNIRVECTQGDATCIALVDVVAKE
jgi:hypothetical protein